jgi:hypothetical protein
MRRLGLWICVILFGSAQTTAVADRAADLMAAATPEAMVSMMIDSEKAEIVTYHHDGGFAITYSLDPWLLTVGTARTDLYLHTQELVPGLFKRLADIDTVIIEAHARMTDIKGNELPGRFCFGAFACTCGMREVSGAF